MSNITETIAADNPCEDCGSTDQTAEPVSIPSWRGWVVTCNECGEIAEYDEPEQLADHREI